MRETVKSAKWRVEERSDTHAHDTWMTWRALHLEPMSRATLLSMQRNTRKCDVWGCSVHITCERALLGQAAEASMRSGTGFLSHSRILQSCLCKKWCRAEWWEWWKRRELWLERCVLIKSVRDCHVCTTREKCASVSRVRSVLSSRPSRARHSLMSVREMFQKKKYECARFSQKGSWVKEREFIHHFSNHCWSLPFSLLWFVPFFLIWIFVVGLVLHILEALQWHPLLLRLSLRRRRTLFKTYCIRSWIIFHNVTSEYKSTFVFSKLWF